MRKFAGEEQLRKHSEESFSRRVEKINEKVYFFAGFGGSNMTLLVGEESCVLIDALNGKEVAEAALVELRKITDKPIGTIIYTHYDHFDHISGAAVFADENTEIIGHSYNKAIYGYSNLLENVNKKRGMHQFGAMLSQEDSISVGIGIWNNPYSTRAPKRPNVLVDDEIVKIERAGFALELVAAPGETDDQMFIWLPEYKLMCCGDNYYESWPNLYAIRGSQYRDISLWIDSLRKMASYPVEILVPGHTGIVYGEKVINEMLTNYGDALEYVLVETLKGMNEGMTIDELAERIVLPEKWSKLPYLQEYYGTVAWSVKAIFTGYLGWFDGNATNLGQMPIKKKAEKTLAMMGGVEKVLEEIKDALTKEEDQWAAELCDLLLNANVAEAEAKMLKAEALTNLGRMQTSANGRHYYLTAAKLLQQ